MILGIILVVFWMVLVPLILGLVLCPPEQDIIKWKEVANAYLLGMIFVYALFEIITVPLTFMKQSLKLVLGLWAIICLVFIIIGGIYRFVKQERRLKFEYNKQKVIDVWGLGAFFLIIFQLVYIAGHMHIDDDDAWYVGTAVASYATDTINRIYPYTGEIMNIFPSDYTLSPYPIFYAMLGKLTFLHPAILMHTVMPIVLIGTCYIIYCLIGSKLYSDKKGNVGCFIFFLALFNLFGNFSVRSVSTFLLFRIWQGKAVLANLFIPLIIYCFMNCIEKNEKREWIFLFTCVIAGTMVSSMGVFLISVLLAVMSFIVLVINKNIRQVFYTALCILPCIIQFGIFLLVLR